MTLAAAQAFIQRAVSDHDMVDRIQTATDDHEVRQILIEMGFEFNHEEFEQAYYNVLTWCQTESQADHVKEIKLWWDCMGYFFGVVEKG